MSRVLVNGQGKAYLANGDALTIDGSGTVVNPLNVTENGTYTAPAGTAYSPVTVNVPGIVPSGAINITDNGTYDVSSKASAVVNVPGIVPSGSINITQNGTYDVSSKASAVVNVPGSQAIAFVNSDCILISGYYLGISDPYMRTYEDPDCSYMYINLSDYVGKFFNLRFTGGTRQRLGFKTSAPTASVWRDDNVKFLYQKALSPSVVNPFVLGDELGYAPIVPSTHPYFVIYGGGLTQNAPFEITLWDEPQRY